MPPPAATFQSRCVCGLKIQARLVMLMSPRPAPVLRESRAAAAGNGYAGSRNAQDEFTNGTPSVTLTRLVRTRVTLMSKRFCRLVT